MTLQTDDRYPVLTDLIERVNDIITIAQGSGITATEFEIMDARKGELSLRIKIDKIDAAIVDTKNYNDDANGKKYTFGFLNGELYYKEVI